jgi:integrase
MERTYESAVALVDRATGPLASHLGLFVTSLISRQYTASVIYIKALHAVAFDRWLAKHRVVLSDLGDVHRERYRHRRRARQQRIRAEARRIECCDVRQLLEFLRDRGVCPTVRAKATAADDLVTLYQQHLQDQQGLAITTIERYQAVTAQFLYQRFGNGPIDLRALRANDAIAFVQRQTKRLHPPALKCVVNALRSFLRYAQYRGEVATALAAAVPAVAAWATTAALPKAISPAHAQSAIDSCNLSTAEGLRDRAILLLARLGLRAHEIIALQLEDCDWDGGHLRVRSHSRLSAAGEATEPGAAFVFTGDGTDPRIAASLRCHRDDRAPCARARRGGSTASRVTPVSPRIGGAHVATGRFADRDRRSASAPKPTDHLDLRSGGYRRAATAGSAMAGRCAMYTLRFGQPSSAGPVWCPVDVRAQYRNCRSRRECDSQRRRTQSTGKGINPSESAPVRNQWKSRQQFEDRAVK